jgi:hypothetical protein
LRIAFVLLALIASQEAPVDGVRAPVPCVETPLVAAEPEPRSVHWAAALEPVEVESASSREIAAVRLYATDGSIDESARETFERIAAGADDAHALTVRLEQLVVKAAHHFGRDRIVVLSAWRPNAGRHSTGDALDFKLPGIRASTLASYLRQLPRVGVGIYTHPKTQFVHLDVRDASYHWLDASPPGVRWREARLRDPSAQRRDAAWTPEMDLPI